MKYRSLVSFNLYKMQLEVPVQAQLKLLIYRFNLYKMQLEGTRLGFNPNFVFCFNLYKMQLEERLENQKPGIY